MAFDAEGGVDELDVEVCSSYMGKRVIISIDGCVRVGC